MYTVEPLNADTFGTREKCPDYGGVQISGVFYRKSVLKTILYYCMSTKPNVRGAAPLTRALFFIVRPFGGNVAPS